MSFLRLYKRESKLFFCTLRKKKNSHIIWDLFLLIHSSSFFFFFFKKWMHVVFHRMIILHYILLSDIFGVCPDFHYCKQYCSGHSCTCLQLCVCDFLWGLMWGIAGDGIWVSSTINLSPTLPGSATIL